MTTSPVVADDVLGRILRKETDLNRRLMEGSLDPDAVELALTKLQLIIEGKPVDAPTLTPAEAAAIMGSNFYGIGQVEDKFGVKFTPKQRKLLSVVPFSAEVLKACAKTHILIPGFALSIMDVHARATDVFYSKNKPWYGEAEQRFATKTKVTVGWHLVRKTALPDSTSKSWSDQQLMVSVPNTIPPACLVVYTAILHFLVTGERIFQNVWVRTSDTSASGDHVNVGFYAGGFNAGVWCDGPLSDIGVAVARKSS